MGVGVGPKLITDSLIFALDSGANFRGFTKYGTAGTNNSNRSAVNLIDKSTIDISNTSNIVTSLASPANQYTMYGITYPESSYSPASRHGITPGFNNTSATKTYSHSRDLGYFVFDDDSNSWVADSYFNGERINGHVYDTYDGLSSDGVSSEHTKFQNDHAAIHDAFPNATHIIIGSHAAENNDNNSDTLAILQSLGLPDSHIGVDRPEYILVGKKNKPSTQSYVRENVSSAVAHLNVLLPLDQTQGVLSFDGTDDQIIYNNVGITDYSQAFSYECVFKAEGTWANSYISNIVGINGSYSGHYGLGKSGTNTVQFVIRDANYSAISGTVSDVSTYHHLVGVWDQSNSQMRLYIDGELASSASSITKTGSPDSDDLRIGGRAAFGGDNGSYYDGVIPVVKYYSTALTADQVKHNFNSYKNRFNI